MPSIVDNLGACGNAVRRLSEETQLGVKIEGVHLCRDGRIAIIELCAANGEAFVFDIAVLQNAAFVEGGLQHILESSRIRKVVFDARICNDALYHIYGFVMVNVYDIQVLHAMKFKTVADRYVDGFSKCLSQSRLLSAPEWRSYESVKKRGKNMFAPERGGDETVWERRPLHDCLLAYCDDDARQLINMKLLWQSSELDVFVSQRSQARIQKTVEHAYPAKGKHMALLDFAILPDASAASCRDTPEVCSICLDSLGQHDHRAPEVRSLPCGHAFHDECLAEHVRHNSAGRAERNCPDCRHPFASIDRALGLPGTVKNLHPVHPFTSARPRGNPRRPCRNLVSTGHCSFGACCRFSHDL